MNADEFQGWVEQREWRVAKTMLEVPHEYVVLAHDMDTFREVENFIYRHGFPAVWSHHKPKPYYVLDGRLYWSLFPVVNRCVLGDPRTDVQPVTEAEGAESRGLASRPVGGSDEFN